MLKTGDKMPSFEVMDQDGNMVRSEDFIGKGKKTIIYFYPKDNTSGCTAEACSFRDNYARSPTRVSVPSMNCRSGYLRTPPRRCSSPSAPGVRRKCTVRPHWGRSGVHSSSTRTAFLSALSRKWTPRTPPGRYWRVDLFVPWRAERRRGRHSSGADGMRWRV